MISCRKGHEIRVSLRGGLKPTRGCKFCCQEYVALGVKVSPRCPPRKPDPDADLKIASWWVLSQAANKAVRDRRNSTPTRQRPRAAA